MNPYFENAINERIFIQSYLIEKNTLKKNLMTLNAFLFIQNYLGFVYTTNNNYPENTWESHNLLLRFVLSYFYSPPPPKKKIYTAHIAFIFTLRSTYSYAIHFNG